MPDAPSSPDCLTSDGDALRGATGAGVRVAVIDSGIAPGHPHVGRYSSGMALVGDHPTDVADRLGHGTAVAAAIREKAPGCEIIPVRVLDRQLATSARVLAEAIDWAVEHGAHLVNLSLGTTNEAHVPLFEASLHAAAARGVLVVSAREHAGSRWYPGSLPDAVGVVAVADAPRDALIIPSVPDGDASPTHGTVGASPLPRPIPGVPVDRNLLGVSFAVANATGILALALERGAPRTVDALLHWSLTTIKGTEYLIRSRGQST